MAYTYNDVKNSKAVYALGDDVSETADSMDFASWAALQKTYMSNVSTTDTDSATSAAKQGESHLRGVTQAATQLSTAQSVANVHIMSDNFIRDSITAK